MPTLRGHHLICLHFFSGEGYDQIFIDNLREVLNFVKSEGLVIGTGGDDVCRKCPYLNLQNDSCQYRENADAEIREMDRKALEMLQFDAGHAVAWEVIAGRIPDIFADWFRTCCSDCEWVTICERNDFFRKVRPANS